MGAGSNLAALGLLFSGLAGQSLLLSNQKNRAKNEENIRELSPGSGEVLEKCVLLMFHFVLAYCHTALAPTIAEMY